MSNSSDIDNGLVAKLAADATLLALMPNGVYFGEAPPGSEAWVSVQIFEAHDEPVYADNEQGFEDILYLVMAVARENTNMYAAAARIHTLLHNQTITVTGYSAVTASREDRHRPKPFPDDDDLSINWFQRGGFYRIQAAV